MRFLNKIELHQRWPELTNSNTLIEIEDQKVITTDNSLPKVTTCRLVYSTVLSEGSAVCSVRTPEGRRGSMQRFPPKCEMYVYVPVYKTSHFRTP